MRLIRKQILILQNHRYHYDLFNPQVCSSLKFSDSKSRSFSKSSVDSPSNSAVPVVSTIGSPHEKEIDAGSSIRKPISLWPGMYHSPVTNALWEARSNLFQKLGDAPSHTHLLPKTPAKSRTSILYKFSSDYTLTEQYRNPWNEIRIGKLLEDLDALAGTIAYKVNPSQPLLHSISIYIYICSCLFCFHLL